MTVIVAVSDGTRVCMACDSQATSAVGAKVVLAVPKIIRRRPNPTVPGVLFGADGSMAVSEFLNRHYTGGPEGATVAAIAADFAIKLRRYLRDHGLMRKMGDGEELPCQVLVAWQSEFVLVDAGGSVINMVSRWWAIGSGGAEARGALFVAEKLEHAEADLMARDAVEAAISLDDGCGLPVHIEWTDMWP